MEMMNEDVQVSPQLLSECENKHQIIAKVLKEIVHYKHIEGKVIRLLQKGTAGISNNYYFQID